MEQFAEFEDFYKIKSFLSQTRDSEHKLVVTGEKGIGKTSLLHWIESQDGNRLIVFVLVKEIQENKDFIIELTEEILRKIPNRFMKNFRKEDKEKIAEIRKRLGYEKTKKLEEIEDAFSEKEIKGNSSGNIPLLGRIFELSGGYKKGKSSGSRIIPKTYDENILQLFRDFTDIINIFTSNSGKKMLICIDEGHYLFKEKMEVHKELFVQNDCSFIFTGYPTMLQRINEHLGGGFYTHVRISFIEDQIRDILHKRVNFFSFQKENPPRFPFEDDAVEIILKLGKNNPKRVLQIANETLNHAAHKDAPRIDAEFISRFLADESIKLGRNLDYKERIIIKELVKYNGRIEKSLLKRNLASRREFADIENRTDLGTQKTSMFDIFFRNLVNKGIIEVEKEDQEDMVCLHYAIEFHGGA
ncbi:MAG: hypothetical protein HXS54_03060 [Theionarchaea archaeon]|nr:hypothetical protein [Theionarchaea archaeon]